MESIQSEALSQFPPGPFASAKIELGARFGHLLGRHVGLCHPSQALGRVMSNAQLVRSLATTWDDINFTAIKSKRKLASESTRRY